MLMMTDSDLKKEFFNTLVILKDYLSDIVIAGGWAPLIYYHYLLSDKNIRSLRTKDIDIVVPESLKKRREKTINELLLEAGFKPKFKSLHTPPVVSYEGIIGNYEVEIEFLTHRRGPKEDIVIEVQKGLHAQSLRFISLLLDNTIDVDIDDFLIADRKKLKIRVPTPGAYIFQKGLIFVRRNKRLKKAKDLYYIFDILSNCQKLHNQIISDFGRFRELYPKNWTRQFLKYLRKYFLDTNAEGIHLIQSQRPPSAFPGMKEEQFAQYTLSVFQEFIRKIEAK
jgi:hypothetical protein